MYISIIPYVHMYVFGWPKSFLLSKIIIYFDAQKQDQIRQQIISINVHMYTK